MNCRDFSIHIGDYVNRTLSQDLVCDAQAHLSRCSECSALVRELEGTSLMVRSLHRMSTPSGFEQRLKDRIALRHELGVPAEYPGPVRRWLRAVREAGRAPAHQGSRVFRPALVGLLLCLVVAGSFLVIGQDRYSPRPTTDWGYIETCRDQHASFASANPLADDSAILLRERAHDLGDDL